jgi:Ca2+-binding EF-hand superfamily protein
MGWFAASDSNNDGFVNKSEFLGSNDDFSAYDGDNDGFISQNEAYKTETVSLQ